MDFKSIKKARKIYAAFKPYKVELSRNLTDAFGRTIFFKPEHRNLTGSFKERGVLNTLLNLGNVKGVITASAGNHGLALSYHAKKIGIPCTIVCPKYTPVAKLSKIKSLGVNVELSGENFDESYHYALELQKKTKQIFVHPFDDPLVIAGQGTIGLEVIQELPEVRSLILPIGGGGLASGVLLAVKELKPRVKVYGVRLNFSQQNEIHKPISLADGIAVKKLGSLTGKVIENYIDDIFTADEESIAEAILTALEMEKLLLEGAAAVTLIPIIKKTIKNTLFPTCLIFSGSNIDISLLSRLILRKLRKSSKLTRFRIAVPDKPGMLGLCASTIGQCGGQIIQTYHDRLDTPTPNTVGITFLVEVLDKEHSKRIEEQLKKFFGIVESS
ncbi:MAG: pyridoxal-phosphate dependent enzyme [Deltaproteobacteria bacterium]|nr:pyridoxal-phosphate dependent enzyme [Deltaproteobacteria bacterium]MCX7952856.1 pyridoxal-phosphate dependent enzyme [Deltaproteobacteria bacterium]